MGHAQVETELFEQLGQPGVGSSNPDWQSVDFEPYFFTEVVDNPRHCFFITYLLHLFKVQRWEGDIGEPFCITGRPWYKQGQIEFTPGGMKGVPWKKC